MTRDWRLCSSDADISGYKQQQAQKKENTTIFNSQSGCLTLHNSIIAKALWTEDIWERYSKRALTFQSPMKVNIPCEDSTSKHWHSEQCWCFQKGKRCLRISWSLEYQYHLLPVTFMYSHSFSQTMHHPVNVLWISCYTFVGHLGFLWLVPTLLNYLLSCCECALTMSSFLSYIAINCVNSFEKVTQGCTLLCSDTLPVHCMYCTVQC